jgi:hypothetical protein
VVIKVVNIQDDNETCRVGFLHRDIVYGRRKNKLRNKYGQLLEIYKESMDFTKKRKNHRLGGVASYRLLDEIQDLK